MKKFLTVFGILSILANTAYARADTTKSDPKKKAPSALKRRDWSSFLDVFSRQNPELPKIQFETGVLAYYMSKRDWTFSRVEPFIKLRWALLDKYIQLYTIFSIDTPTTFDYKLSDAEYGSTKVSANAIFKSMGNSSFGGGLQLFIFGWKKLEFFANIELQVSTLGEGSIEEAKLAINDVNLDILEAVSGHLDISYQMQRYDCGLITSYKFFNWFSASATVGYIWFKASMKLSLDEELSSTIKTLTKLTPTDIMPKRLAVDEGSVFALLSLKFKLYKRLYAILEGAVLPTENPVYLGLISLGIEGDR